LDSKSHICDGFGFDKQSKKWIKQQTGKMLVKFTAGVADGEIRVEKSFPANFSTSYSRLLSTFEHDPIISLFSDF